MTRFLLSLFMLFLVASSNAYFFPFFPGHQSSTAPRSPDVESSPSTVVSSSSIPSPSSSASTVSSSSPMSSTSASTSIVATNSPVPSLSPSTSPITSISPIPQPSSSTSTIPSGSSIASLSPSSTTIPSSSVIPSPSPPVSTTATTSPISSPSPSSSTLPSSSLIPSPSPSASTTTSSSPIPSPSPSSSTTTSSSSTPSPSSSSSPASGECGETQWAAAKTALFESLSKEPDVSRWPARLLFSAFHDCLPHKCDASILHEQHRVENSKVGITLNKLNEIRDGTCVTLSDMIKIGLEVAMQLSGGPTVNCPKGNNPDAATANPAGRLPSPIEPVETLVSKFTRQAGITVEEAVAANFGGHSYGGFGVNPDTHIPVIFFTSKPDKLDIEYCSNLLSPQIDTGRVLPSDLAYVQATNTRSIVARFESNPGIFRTVFGSFLNKLCTL